MPGRRSRARGRTRIHGTDRLRRRLAELGDVVLQASAAAVKSSAEAVQAGTRDRVRVDTGALRDHVGIHYATGGLAAKVGWKDRADWYATVQEFGSRSVPAQPALGPALEEERARFEARLREEIRRRL